MAGSTSWLDDDPYGYQNPDPWGTGGAPAAGGAAPPPGAPAATAPSNDWSTSAAPQPSAAPTYSTDLGNTTPVAPAGGGVDPGQVQAGADRGGVTGAGTSGGPAADLQKYQSHLTAIHSASDPQSKAVAQDALARQLQQDLTADGHKVTWKGNVLMVDGRPYELAGEGVEASTPGGPNGRLFAGGWENASGASAALQEALSLGLTGQAVADYVSAHGFPGAASYYPGKNQFGLPGSYVAPNPQNPTSFDLIQRGVESGPSGGGGSIFGGGGNQNDWLSGASQSLPGGFEDSYARAAGDSQAETDTDALVRNLLAHPESLSETDVARLEGKNAEEQAVAAQLADEELQHFGYHTGLDSSPWLAGQRETNQWNRRTATIEGNRNVEIAAADRRGADRRSAAALGAQWSNLKSSKKQAALTYALDYVKTNLGFDIDLKKLKQQDDQFQADLVQRIHALQQADDQFRATYSLDAQRLDHQKDQDYWERSKSTAGV